MREGVKKHTIFHSGNFDKVKKWPVNADGDQHGGGKIIPQRSHRHQKLAGQVSRPPLDGEPPGRLQGEHDKADDRVGDGEVEDQVVHVGPRPQQIKMISVFFLTDTLEVPVV